MDRNGMITDLYQMAGRVRPLYPAFATLIRTEIIEIRKNWRIEQPLCGCLFQCYCWCACHRQQNSGSSPLPAYSGETDVN